MPSKHDAAIHPTLVPMHGGLDKKPRFLDRDVITVGRARGCDIGLDAADVSTLHCVVYRARDGMRLRDCGSRTGTRLNGVPVKNNLLCDGDVVQMGPFSFVVQIPPGHSVERKLPEWQKVARWERSRRNLVELALNLRRRLRAALADPSNAAQNDLTHKAADLRAKIRAYDHRVSQLEQAERDLEQDRETLQREKEEHKVHVQKIENEWASRLLEVDEEVHQRWQAFQQRCQHEEARLTHTPHAASEATPTVAPAAPVAPVLIDEEEQRKLEVRKLELEKWAAALRQERTRLEHAKEQCQRGFEEFHKERQESIEMKEQWSAEQVGAEDLLEKQRVALSQAEASLRGQREELSQMMTDLRALQNAIRAQQSADVLSLSKENEELRLMVAELEERVHTESAPPPKLSTNLDLENYETELNQYRHQLETDRTRLNAEIEQLRGRNHELDQATREMEMEMSRERAELARERTRLDRLRDEVKTDLERMQRDASVRQDLAPVQKLREELKKPAGGNFNDRLKSFRNRLSDPA
ncbi:MAG: FHA domain-containing protein [Planctomycetes bacterium]|nr:FHA domain-containing protein [Planctomycetota bacterium]